jgi:hypothetical protein
MPVAQPPHIEAARMPGGAIAAFTYDPAYEGQAPECVGPNGRPMCVAEEGEPAAARRAGGVPAPRSPRATRLPLAAPPPTPAGTARCPSTWATRRRLRRPRRPRRTHCRTPLPTSANRQ